MAYTRRIGLLIAAGCILLYESLAPTLMHAFIPDAETVTLGTKFLRIRALATPMMFLCYYHVHFFQGIGKGGYTLGMTTLRFGIVGIPMVLLLGTVFGMYGLTWAQLAGDSIVAALSFVIYYRFRKRQSVIAVI